MACRRLLRWAVSSGQKRLPVPSISSPATSVLSCKRWSLAVPQAVGLIPRCGFQSTTQCRNKAFEVINVQDEDHFKSAVLQSDVPVVLDFHATWCGPCKLLSPRLEKVLSNHANDVKLAKVDVDDFEDLAIKFRVRGVPAVFGMKNGEVVNSFVGLLEEDMVEGFLGELTS